MPLLGLFASATSLRLSVIRAALHVFWFFGFFRLARYVTRRGLRIICYHGFALAEEHAYRGRLFIRGEFFRRRIEYLKRHGYPILPLAEAVERMKAGHLPACATVITMDDGWRGVYTIGLPIIEQHNLPVTVYVATYYVEHPIPVFTVASSYLFWRSAVRRVKLPRGLGAFDLASETEQAEAAVHSLGDSLPAAGRLVFLRELAAALDVPFAEIEQHQLFRVMDGPQLRALAEAGVDIQLHSHRHQWPLHDRTTVDAEIAENRRLLEPIVPHPLEHFCYPSGVYGLHQGEWLAAMGIKSATTIEPGLNYRATSAFALRRMVDGEPVSEIEFAAEMTGFMEIVRWLRRGRLFSFLRSRSNAVGQP